MKKFLDQHFLLETNTAIKLYEEFAKPMPIIDYHNHLPPNEMAADKNFDNITQVWLNGDHYKWRAMRTNGVNEAFITGEKSDWEKFQAWSATVPYTVRNPLYHWTHLELQRYFGINEILNADSAARIYEQSSSLLQTKEYSVHLSSLLFALRETNFHDDGSLSAHPTTVNGDDGAIYIIGCI